MLIKHVKNGGRRRQRRLRNYESAVRFGRDGSLLKYFRLLVRKQKLRANSILLSLDGMQLSTTANKLEKQWYYSA